MTEFALRCWSVHAFEPDPANRRVLTDGVGQLSNVHVDPRAVSDASGQEVDFFTSDMSTGISSLTAFHPSHAHKARNTTVTLRDYLAEVRVEWIDLLKSDCQSHDLFVLRSLDWEAHHPMRVVCEFEDRKTEGLGYTHRDLTQFLEGAGYIVLVSEWASIVEYGRRLNWRRVTRWPAMVPDSAWGNLIAVSANDVARTLRNVRTVAAQYRLRRLVGKLRL